MGVLSQKNARDILSQKHVIRRFVAESEKDEQADPDTLTKLAASIKEYAKLLT